MNEYIQKKYNNKLALTKPLNDLETGYKFELIKNETELEYSKIVLTGLIPINARYDDYKKEYHFFLDYTHLLYVKYDTYEQVTEKLEIKEPNNIHVLTAAKVKAHIEYLIKVYEKLVEISTQRMQAVEEFKRQVIAAGARIKENTYEFAPKDGTFSGEIVKNGIEFEFQVHAEGYISKDIKIHYKVNDDLDSFLKLSDNKYLEAVK